MIHAVDTRKFLDNRKAVGVRIAVMDDDRHRQTLRQCHLCAERRLLFLARRRRLRRLFDPIVIQTDLADRLNLVLVRQPFDLLHILHAPSQCIFRMNSHRGIDMRIDVRQPNGHLRRFNIASRVDNQTDTILRHGAQQVIAVLIKPVVIVMGMGIK